MKSTIRIDVDQNNHPIIQIKYEPSEDLRDKMVKRFLEAFGGSSCYATFSFDDVSHIYAVHGESNRQATIKPIHPFFLKDHWEGIKIEADKQEQMANGLMKQFEKTA